MAPRDYSTPESQLSPMSVRNDEKRPYQYEEVSVDDRLSKANVIDQHMKKKIRRLRVVQRVLNLIISIIVLGIMVNTYVTFVNHRNIHSGGQTIPIYPVHPVTWPTYMMIATASVSLLFNISVLTAYFWGVAAANKVNLWSSYGGYVIHVINIAVWLATSTTFQMTKGPANAVPPPNDLYGWTCSNKADQLTAQYTLPVNFDTQCKTQQVSTYVGFANVGLETVSFLLTIGVNLYAMRRMIHKKRMELMEQRLDNDVPTVQ